MYVFLLPFLSQEITTLSKHFYPDELHLFLLPFFPCTVFTYNLQLRLSFFFLSTTMYTNSPTTHCHQSLHHHGNSLGTIINHRFATKRNKSEIERQLISYRPLPFSPESTGLGATSSPSCPPAASSISPVAGLAVPDHSLVYGALSGLPSSLCAARGEATVSFRTDTVLPSSLTLKVCDEGSLS